MDDPPRRSSRSLNVGVCRMVRDFTDEQMLAAFNNIGFDPACGACAAVFFCGWAFGHDEHTCLRKP